MEISVGETEAELENDDEATLTEHSQASGQDIVESELHYRRLIEAVTDYIFTVRVENGQPAATTHGPNCVAVTGYTPEEFAANRLLWIAMVPKEDRAAVEEQAAHILAGDDAPPIEHRICRKDGAVRWVMNTCVPHRDSGGKLVSYDGLVRDITERKQAEIALCQVNETLEERVAQRTAELEAANHTLCQTQFTIDHSQDAVFWIKRDGSVFFVNDAACRMTAYTRDELLGLLVPDFDPDMLSAEWDEFWKRAKSDRSLLVERRCLTKDHRTFPVEVSCGYFQFANEEFMCALVRDVSARRQAERALVESEQRLRAILDTAADAVITIDRRGVIEGVNPAAERMFGYTECELMGNNVSILMPKPYSMEHDGYISRYLATGEAKIIGIGREVVACRRDGSTFPIDLAVSEVKELSLFTGVIRDLTDRKALQRQVLDIAAQEQTRIGQDLHDGVGQELTGLNYMTQNLLAALPDKTATTGQLAQRISAGLKETQHRLREVVQGLMPVVVDSEGLRAALEDLAGRVNAAQKMSCYFVCCDHSYIPDNSTATHLYRIAQEAVNNALKHSRGSRIDLLLSADAGRVTLEVADDGIGINAAPREADSLGLGIMHYRASLISARLQIERRDQGGTVVKCDLTAAK